MIFSPRTTLYGDVRTRRRGQTGVQLTRWSGGGINRYKLRLDKGCNNNDEVDSCILPVIKDEKLSESARPFGNDSHRYLNIQVGTWKALYPLGTAI